MNEIQKKKVEKIICYLRVAKLSVDTISADISEGKMEASQNKLFGAWEDIDSAIRNLTESMK